MQLHAEAPVGLAEGKGAPPLALLSSVSGLLRDLALDLVLDLALDLALALEQLVVQRETWNTAKNTPVRTSKRLRLCDARTNELSLLSVVCILFL